MYAWKEKRTINKLRVEVPTKTVKNFFEKMAAIDMLDSTHA